MNAAESKRIIDRDFATLVRACEGSGEASDLLARLLDHAESGERRHRRNRPTPRGFSVQTAVRYFAVKWYAEHQPVKTYTALEASRFRTDALCGMALKDLIGDCFTEPPKTLGVVDYVKLMSAV